MWFKILQLVQVIFSCILEAEIGFTGAPGPEKKETVMKTVTAELRKEGLLGRGDEPAGDALLKSVGGLVDDLVGVLHLTGAFTHASKAAARPGDDPEAKPPPEE
jgi:hypothetical protein